MRRRGRGQEQQTTEKSFVLPPTFKQALKEQKMRMEERKRMQNYRSFEGEREREREPRVNLIPDTKGKLLRRPLKIMLMLLP